MNQGGIGKIFSCVVLTATVALGLIATATTVRADGDSSLRPLPPARLLDTRPGEKTVDGVSAGVGKLQAGSTVTLQVAGRGGVASNASAAFLNITAVLPTADTLLTVYPCDTTRPLASSLNIPKGDIRANNVFAKLSASGTVCIYTVAETDVVVDLNGFETSEGGSVTPVQPARLLDTRPGEKTVDGVSAGVGQAPTGATVMLQVAGRAGVPVDATAAFLNVTAVQPSADTLLTVYPCGVAAPTSSNVNVPRSDIRANGVFVKLSATGMVCIYTVSATDIAIDVNGYVPASSAVGSVQPARLLDTRPGERTIDGVSAGIGQASAGSTVTVQVAGRAGVPANASAAFLNLTGVLPSADNLLTVYPCDVPRPTASNVNLPANDIRANGVFAKLSAAGTVCIYTVWKTDIVVDVNGYAPAGPGVATLVSCDAIAEAVVIRNVGGTPVNLDGYRLHDEGENYTGTLSGTLAPGQSVTYVSGKTPSSPGVINWNNNNVWNNQGDTAYLVAPDGTVTTQVCST